MVSEQRTWYKYHVLCSLTILPTSYPAYEDGTDRVFRNFGIQQSDAGEIPKKYIKKFTIILHQTIPAQILAFSNDLRHI